MLPRFLPLTLADIGQGWLGTALLLIWAAAVVGAIAVGLAVRKIRLWKITR